MPLKEEVLKKKKAYKICFPIRFNLIHRKSMGRNNCLVNGDVNCHHPWKPHPEEG